MKTRRKNRPRQNVTDGNINNHTELIIKNPKNQKQEWLLAFLGKMQTHERLKRTLFVRTKHNMRIFGVIPFMKI